MAKPNVVYGKDAADYDGRLIITPLFNAVYLTWIVLAFTHEWSNKWFNVLNAIVAFLLLFQGAMLINNQFFPRYNVTNVWQFAPDAVRVIMQPLISIFWLISLGWLIAILATKSWEIPGERGRSVSFVVFTSLVLVWWIMMAPVTVVTYYYILKTNDPTFEYFEVEPRASMKPKDVVEA